MKNMPPDLTLRVVAPFLAIVRQALAKLREPGRALGKPLVAGYCQEFAAGSSMKFLYKFTVLP